MAGQSNDAHGGDAVRGVVPSTYVRLLFDYLRQQGVDAEQVLGEAPPPADNQGLGRYPVARWRGLLERAADHRQDPLLGLRLGQAIQLSHFGLMGYVFHACGSVSAALLRLRQFHRLLHDVNPLQVYFDGGTVTLEWSAVHGKPGALVSETALTALVKLLRELTGTPVVAGDVRFFHPAPAETRPYGEFFGGPVHFGQPVTAVRFAASVLTLPVRHADPVLLAVLDQHAQALLDALPGDDDLVQGVRRCLMRQLRDGEPSLDAVAAELYLSPRTLHRRLTGRALSFRQLLEEVRRQLAEDYLRDPRLTLVEVARLVGFSEQSAFQRAFKRWTGQTPGEFRVRRAS